MSNDDDDDDQYIDLSDDEDDLSDLYPGKFYFNECKTCSNNFFLFLDFRRLQTSDSGAGTTTELPEEDSASGTKRKAQTSQVRNKR